MLTEDGPKLLEYNVRFGDPETQAILVRLKSDLLAIFDSMYSGTLGSLDVEWSEGASACVVAANKGYPGKYESGGVIEGLDAFREGPVQVFHAGTSRDATGGLSQPAGAFWGSQPAPSVFRTPCRSVTAPLRKSTGPACNSGEISAGHLDNPVNPVIL